MDTNNKVYLVARPRKGARRKGMHFSASVGELWKKEDFSSRSRQRKVAAAVTEYEVATCHDIGSGSLALNGVPATIGLPQPFQSFCNCFLRGTALVCIFRRKKHDPCRTRLALSLSTDKAVFFNCLGSTVNVFRRGVSTAWDAGNVSRVPMWRLQPESGSQKVI